MLLALLVTAASLSANDAPAGSVPVKWSFKAVELANGHVRIDMTASIDPGWHVYATQLPSDEGPLPTLITLKGSDRFTLIGTPAEPEPHKAHDPNFGMMVHHHSGTTVFSQVIARRTGDKFTVSGSVEYMACDDRMCLPPLKVPFALEVPALNK